MFLGNETREKSGFVSYVSISLCFDFDPMHGSMKTKEVSEQEDVALMANTERGLSKSSPISKRTVNGILVEEFVLPNGIFLTRLSLRPHVVRPLSASKLRSSQDVVLMVIRTNQRKRDPSEYAA